MKEKLPGKQYWDCILKAMASNQCLRSYELLALFFFPNVKMFIFFPFVFISWRLITLQYCSSFAIQWHESAMDLHVFPIPMPPPASLSIPSLWVFPVLQPWALVSCIQPGLLICFTLDSILVSMLFSPLTFKRSRNEIVSWSGILTVNDVKHFKLHVRSHHWNNGSGMSMNTWIIDGSRGGKSWADYNRMTSETGKEAHSTMRVQRKLPFLET